MKWEAEVSEAITYRVVMKWPKHETASNSKSTSPGVLVGRETELGYEISE